jgi:hypothetical protein
MILKKLSEQGSLKRHITSKQEIASLVAVIKRDIKDSHIRALSCDRRFATAYNAALQTATMLIYCEGYMPTGWGHHYTAYWAKDMTLSRIILTTAGASVTQQTIGTPAKYLYLKPKN